SRRSNGRVTEHMRCSTRNAWNLSRANMSLVLASSVPLITRFICATTGHAWCCKKEGEGSMTTATAIVPSSTLNVTQFQHLADVPPEIEWFANLTNANTRRAYRQDLVDFMAFAGLRQPAQFRDVTRAHVIAWREQLVEQGLANDTIRRKLAALSSLYAYLCDRNAVLHNPVLGVKRPRSLNRDGVTPALGDHQARLLLEAPPEGTLKGKRDRAILATLLYHGLRCEELCT